MSLDPSLTSQLGPSRISWECSRLLRRIKQEYSKNKTTHRVAGTVLKRARETHQDMLIVEISKGMFDRFDRREPRVGTRKGITRLSGSSLASCALAI